MTRLDNITDRSSAKSPATGGDRVVLGNITVRAYGGIVNLDKTFVGTYDYMGIAWFWSYEYRHYMRDASEARRRWVHKKMLDAGLSVNGESPEHLSIIRQVTGQCGQC